MNLVKFVAVGITKQFMMTDIHIALAVKQQLKKEKSMRDVLDYIVQVTLFTLCWYAATVAALSL